MLLFRVIDIVLFACSSDSITISSSDNTNACSKIIRGSEIGEKEMSVSEGLLISVRLS